jgi:hypothetical protein
MSRKEEKPDLPRFHGHLYKEERDEIGGNK